MRAAPSHAAGREPDPRGGDAAPHHAGASPGLIGALAVVAVLVALAVTAGATLYLTGALGGSSPQPRMAGAPTAGATGTPSTEPTVEPAPGHTVEPAPGHTTGPTTGPAAGPTTEPAVGPTTGATPGATPGETGAEPSAGGTSAPGGRSREQWARLVLAGWDTDRAQAWRRGDPAALRDLYVPGSRAAVRDLELLRRWDRAGWRLRELRTEVQRLSVLGVSRRQVVLRVRDRVVGVLAEDERTGRLRRWPPQQWQTRTLRLRRAETRWKVASVT